MVGAELNSDVPTNLVRMNLYVDGRCIAIWTSPSNYDALVYDKVFIRTGEKQDSAGVWNTTREFVEDLKS